MPQTTLATAQQVMEAVPLVMRSIRAQLRSHRRADSSVPQFRTMSYIDQNDGASLSELASFIGLSLPSMSKLIEGLVARKLVTRVSASLDRRRICLSLTALGRDELRSARRSTERYLGGRLAGLDEAELEAVAHAMQLLKELFEQEARASTLLNEP
jgi:DNA-binding MarR family transcriptional regulator